MKAKNIDPLLLKASICLVGVALIVFLIETLLGD